MANANANVKSNIHFITGMEIDTCRYLNSIQEEAVKCSSCSIEDNLVSKLCYSLCDR